MKITGLSEADMLDMHDEARARVARMTLFCEGYGRTYDMKYGNWHRDPKPVVLALGYYTHPSTGNRLLCGLNLNTLDSEHIRELQQALPQILRAGKNPKLRYQAGKKLVPDIFKGSYRTYNTDYIDIIKPGTLKFWNVKADFAKEKERVLQLQKDRLQKKKAAKAGQIAKTPRKPKEIPYEPDPRDQQPAAPTVKPAIGDKLKTALIAKKRLKAEKIKQALQAQEKEKQDALQARQEISKAAKLAAARAARHRMNRAAQRRVDVPYESYVRKHPLVEGQDVVIYNLSTGQIIADSDHAQIMLANAGWQIDNAVIFRRDHKWVAEHAYKGVREVTNISRRVGRLIRSIVE